MKNVLFFITSLQGGGAEKQVITDANGLSDREYNVSVAFAEEGELKDFLGNSIQLFQIRKGFKSFFDLYKLLKINKFDLIICHSPWTFNVIPLPALLTGHKWVMFMHGMNFWRNGSALFFFRLAAKLADKIFITSEASRDRRVHHEKLKPVKIRKLYNSFSTGRDMVGIKPANVKKEVINIGCVARFDNVKQLHLFVELCDNLLQSNFTDFKIILVGKGESWQAIRQLILQHGFDKYFEMPGFVDHLFEYYYSFDVFVLPSKIEDLSVSLLEASSYGIPCIAFNVGGNSEIIIDDKTGWLLQPFSVPALADKILFVKDNPVKLKAMGELAAARIAQQFSPAQRLNALSQIIEDYS